MYAYQATDERGRRTSTLSSRTFTIFRKRERIVSPVYSFLNISAKNDDRHIFLDTVLLRRTCKYDPRVRDDITNVRRKKRFANFFTNGPFFSNIVLFSVRNYVSVARRFDNAAGSRVYSNALYQFVRSRKLFGGTFLISLSAVGAFARLVGYNNKRR